MKFISSLLVLLLAIAAQADQTTTQDPRRWCQLNLGPAWGGSVCH